MSPDDGVEFEIVCSRIFTSSWDSLGMHEGQWLRELPVRGNAVLDDAEVAIWVSQSGRWNRFVRGWPAFTRSLRNCARL